MSKENNNSEFLDKLAQIKELVDECISIHSTFSLPLKIPKKKELNKALPSVDFTIPIRPFIKKYSSGMSGPKKFTLLVAYLTKADSGKTVTLEEIRMQWNKMKGKPLFGMEFNLFYSSSAKDKDWVYVPLTASYSVRPSWKDIFYE